MGCFKALLKKHRATNSVLSERCSKHEQLHQVIARPSSHSTALVDTHLINMIAEAS